MKIKKEESQKIQFTFFISKLLPVLLNKTNKLKQPRTFFTLNLGVSVLRKDRIVVSPSYNFMLTIEVR